MRWLVVALVLSTSAYAEDGWDRARRWTWYDVALETAFVGVTMVDWMQTTDFRRHGGEESNPILGSHPSQAKVNLFIGGAILGHVVLAHLSPRPLRTVWQCMYLSLEVTAVRSNHAMGAGLRLPF